jgi:PhzF family phenazine biosynthesis protein
MDFWIVDTFSTKPLCGSPSAVVFLDDFSDEQLMQNIAMELNVPEIAFARKSGGCGDYEIIPFCPTKKGLYLGNSLFAVSHIISSQKIIDKSTFNLALENEIYEIDISEKIGIKFNSPEISKVPTPHILSGAINGIIIVSVAESGGALIIEVRSPSKIANFSPNTDMLKHLEHDVIIITADTHYDTDISYDFCTRVFAPKLGVIEDRVTPLAHLKLGMYWKSRIEKSKLVGYQDSRSAGYVDVNCEDDFVRISGSCTTITKGTLFL